MEFSINNSVLKAEANLLTGVAERKYGINALASLLIESTDGGILLTATDLETTIEAQVSATVKKEGSICIPAKKLCDISKSLDDGIVTFKKESNDWVRVTCGTSKFRVKGIDKAQFPTTPTVEDNGVNLDSKDLKNLIKHTCFAMTQEESRFALNGAKLEVRDGKATMVTTDGHRISLMSVPVSDEEALLDVLIPKKVLVEVAKFLGSDVDITDSQNHIKFVSDHRVIISRKLALPFPDYKLAIPKENNIKVSVNAENVVKSLKRASIMADERHKSVKIDLQEDKILINAVGDGESQEEVSASVQNYPKGGFSINLNCQYLIEYLEICENPVFGFKDVNSAVEITDDTSIYILMPLRAG